MHKLIGISFFAILVSICSCQKDKVGAVELPDGFFENNWSATKQSAQEHDKKIFIHFYKPNCTKCAAFKRDVLNETEVETYIKDNMIGASLNTKETDGESVSQEFGITGHPAMAITDKEGKLIVKRLGAIQKDDFLDWLKANQ